MSVECLNVEWQVLRVECWAFERSEWGRDRRGLGGGARGQGQSVISGSELDSGP